MNKKITDLFKPINKQKSNDSNCDEPQSQTSQIQEKETYQNEANDRE